MSKSNDIRKRPKWIFEAVCPFCKKVTSTYVDFKDYDRELTEEEVEEYDKWIEEKSDVEIIDTPCEHLALKTNCYESDAFIEKRWHDVLLRLIEFCKPDLDYNYPITSPHMLDKYLNEYITENPYELDEELTELLPEYSLKIDTVETSSEFDPYPYDTSFSILYIKEKAKRIQLIK